MTLRIGGQLGSCGLGAFELARNPLTSVGSKAVTQTTIAAAIASDIRPVIFLQMQFDDGNVNLHSELGTISFNGDTYIGVGTLGQISATNEVSDLSVGAMSLTLSGLPTSEISLFLTEQYQSRIATLFLGYLDLVKHTLVDTPTVIYRGLMDTADYSIDKTTTITISIGNRFAAWDTPNIRRYNNSFQQSLYPGDTGLQYIEQTTNKTIIWGSSQ